MANMQEEIRKYLREIIEADKFKVDPDSIKIEIESERSFKLYFDDGGNISVGMSKGSDLKKCVRNTLNNYSDHHNI